MSELENERTDNGRERERERERERAYKKNMETGERGREQTEENTKRERKSNMSGPHSHNYQSVSMQTWNEVIMCKEARTSGKDG